MQYVFKYLHFNLLLVHIKYTSKMATRFYAQFTYVTAPHV